MKDYFVYIMASATRTLYVGVTNDLMRRVYEHKYSLVDGFTSHYGVTQLVYYETSTDIDSAIQREKQIKGWRRSKKIWLIEAENLAWIDLSHDWYD